MPRSTEKTILIVTTTHAKRRNITPVAVFVSPNSAKTFAAKLYQAFHAGDVTRVVALAPKFRMTDDGALPDEAKFSVLTVPYEPVDEAADFSFLDEGDAAT
jgi:hypothetical protein